MNTQIHLQQLNAWEEALHDLEQENAMLKIKLSELVDNSVMADFLHKAELLNNELIANDESVTVLLSTVNHLQENIEIPEKQNTKSSDIKLSSLAADIEKFRNRFSSMKHRFQKEFRAA